MKLKLRRSSGNVSHRDYAPDHITRSNYALIGIYSSQGVCLQLTSRTKAKAVPYAVAFSTQGQETKRPAGDWKSLCNRLVYMHGSLLAE